MNRSTFSRPVRLSALVLVVMLLLPSTSLHATQTTVELPQQPYLPLEMAVQAASAAVAQCEADGYRVSVAVVDRGGVLKVLLRADGTGPHTVTSSTRKAYTAASLGRSTAELAKNVASNPEIEGLRNMDPQILILAGGLPIVVNETVVGGIGVGGAPGGNLDEACAQAGIDAMLAEGSDAEAAAEPTPTPKP